MIINRLIYVIKAIGVPGIVNAIRYAILRDRIERRSHIMNTVLPKITPGNLMHAAPINNGLKIDFDHASLEIVHLTGNMVRISWSPGKPPVSYTISKSSWETFSPEVLEEDDGFVITCGKILVTISNLGELKFSNPDRATFKNDLPPSRQGECWTLSSSLAIDEHIYGLGERASSLNLRKGTYRSWNTDPGGNYSHGTDPLYINTPIYLSLKGVGSHLVYHENSFQNTFSIDDTLDVTFSGGMLRYYVIIGSLSTIYTELSGLIGKPDIPPMWSLGYHQCRWGYRSEADILGVVKGFGDHDFPISAVHLDIDYMDQFMVFSVNQGRFPSLKHLANDLAEKGIRVVTSINPAVKIDNDYPVYTEGAANDAFCKLPDGKVMKGVSWSGWSVFPDFTKSSTRDWWKRQYKVLIDQGVAGIWHDMNEPASFAAWGDKTLPQNTVHDMDGQGGDHQEAHNIYGLLMSKSCFEAFRELSPSKRPWLFSRSGWAGLQRYAWNWTGDIESSWEALQQTLPTILGLGLCGHAFAGVDIGGFSGTPDAELYLRWFQLSAFLPLFRTHSAIGIRPREPWVFGEPVTSIARNFARLRYKLLPYYYTLAWKSAQSGFPPVRPIYWEAPGNRSLWDIEDEFLLGESILVAPIVHPSQHSRVVTFPGGSWYSFWNDQRFENPSKAEIQAPNEYIPLFVKAGTLLPLNENGTFTIHIYPGDELPHSSEMYSDIGDGYGPYRVDTFTSTTFQKVIKLEWSSRGEFPFPYSTVTFILHGMKLENLVVDGNIHPYQDNAFTTNVFRSAELAVI